MSTTSVINRTSDPSDNAVTSQEDIETATWTRHLPQALGIRQAVQQSKYRHCVRESGMWAIATGTAMTLHRFRLQSSLPLAVHVGFTTFFVVYVGSYYFGVKRRDHQEKMIHLMMKLNSFDHAVNMPEPIPVDEHHPFVEAASTSQQSPPPPPPPPPQYVAVLPERKEWQTPLPPKDPAELFQFHGGDTKDHKGDE